MWQYNDKVKLRICPKYLSNPNQMKTNRRYDWQWYDFRITSIWFKMSYSYSITQGITSVMIPLDLITSRLCQSDSFFYSRVLFPLINWLWIMAVIWNDYTVTTVREGKKITFAVLVLASWQYYGRSVCQKWKRYEDFDTQLPILIFLQNFTLDIILLDELSISFNWSSG